MCYKILQKKMSSYLAAASENRHLKPVKKTHNKPEFERSFFLVGK
jgi:hypothetical protein